MKNKSTGELLLGISSSALPNDISLTLTHKRDYNASDESSQFNYSFLIYEFRNSQGNIVSARSYFDEPQRTSLFYEKTDVDLNNVESTETGKLLKSAYLSLCALGYFDISILGDEGYETLTMPQVNIDETDVVKWASKMDELERHNHAH